MSGDFKEPTHNRLLTVFKSVGPYVREKSCIDGCYLFDCLSVCVDEKESPDAREFWGWWVEISKDGDIFKGKSNVGRYDVSGTWIDEKLTSAVTDEVKRTYDVFSQKITLALKDKFNLDIHLDSL